MNRRNYFRILNVVVWSVVPLVLIYRFIGWYAVLVMSVILNSKRVWQMMIQRNPSYIYILNAQMKLCSLALLYLL